MKVIFRTESFDFIADFNYSQTAKELLANLPIVSRVSTWGNEIYFDTGFKACAEGAVMEVEKGDIGYWPQGKCLCVFFGSTPASTTEKPVPASPVVVVGKTDAPADKLKSIQLGEKITVEFQKDA